MLCATALFSAELIAIRSLFTVAGRIRSPLRADGDKEERKDELVIDLVTERIIASTRNQPVEIAFIFEFLISNKLYTATLIITIIPP